MLVNTKNNAVYQEEITFALWAGFVPPIILGQHERHIFQRRRNIN